ncbi:MAG: 1,4-dihydroxy-2-naphthoate polyprenyltransferase, partial [Planctomycetota bacterium]
ARPHPLRVWGLAIRPATLWASVVPVGVGSALAAADGAFRPGPAAAALGGGLLIQIATNLYNDAADFARGADTEARLGPARAAQKGWLSRRALLAGTTAALLAALLLGLYLTAVAGWPILVLGLLSLGCALAYSGGPWPLAYVGLGDLFVLLFFGGFATAGTYYVQALTLTPTVALASLSLGLLATAILVVNNLRDRHTDARCGKRTLAVRWGERFARTEYLACLAGAYLAAAAAAHAARAPALLAPWLTLPLAFLLARAVAREDGAALNRRLGQTALLQLAFGALFSVGALW